MTEEELDKWWCHLTVEKKEALAQQPYPECSDWWCHLTTEHKEAIYNDAGGRNAHQHHQWAKGNGSFTD